MEFMYFAFTRMPNKRSHTQIKDPVVHVRVGLLKEKSNPACTKSVRVLRVLQMNTIRKRWGGGGETERQTASQRERERERAAVGIQIFTAVFVLNHLSV